MLKLNKFIADCDIIYLGKSALNLLKSLKEFLQQGGATGSSSGGRTFLIDV